MSSKWSYEPVRILEALKILEAAASECTTRDTPEAREALDVLEPYSRPEWRITGFRAYLKRHEEFGPGGEGQQQVLRVYFLYPYLRATTPRRSNRKAELPV